LIVLMTGWTAFQPALVTFSDSLAASKVREGVPG